MNPQAVADLVAPEIINRLKELSLGSPQVFMRPEEGQVTLRDPDSTVQVTFTDIRFCCAAHCYDDVGKEFMSRLPQHELDMYLDRRKEHG